MAIRDQASKLSPASRQPTLWLFLLLILLLPELVAAAASTQPTGSAALEESYYYNYHGQADNLGGQEYLSDWNNPEWVKLSGRNQQYKCVEIPSNLTLCHAIGYKEMMLPNLLDHDTLNEVTVQAASWVPLTRINCHPETRLFLCSLFSPICLERLIYPCRSLCQVVQTSCVGVLKAYGFDWPDMFKCDKFPLDNDMCIKSMHDAKPDNVCTACKHPLTHESMIDQFCRSNIAMRVTIKEFKIVGGNKELVLQKKKSVYKHHGDTDVQAKSLRVVLEGGASCTCDNINATKGRYLIMGNRVGDTLVVTFGIEWNRQDKEFKKGIHTIQKGKTCEGIFRELAPNGAEVKPTVSAGKVDKTKKNNKKGKGKGKGKQQNKEKGKKGKKKDKGKGKKKKQGQGKKNKTKKETTSAKTSGSRRGNMSKAELEDRAISNFMRASN